MFHPDGPTFRELLAQALSSTEEGYNKLAPKFDTTPFRTPDDLLTVVGDTLAPFSLRRGIDLCCGTGAGMRMLRRHCREEVVGIDSSPGMLEEAKLALQDAPGDAALSFESGDVLSLPYESEFDIATCFGAFGHIEERDEPLFVRNVAKCLRPGGRFVFVTGDRPSPLSPAVVVARGFNAVMRVRNALISPPFIMYYLTFLLPRAKPLLEAVGFEVSVTRDLFPRPFGGLVLVHARLR